MRKRKEWLVDGGAKVGVEPKSKRSSSRLHWRAVNITAEAGECFRPNASHLEALRKDISRVSHMIYGLTDKHCGVGRPYLSIMISSASPSARPSSLARFIFLALRFSLRTQ